MSWDARLTAKTTDGIEIPVYDTNYTHNTNKMANEALRRAGHAGPSWWVMADGRTGGEVAEMLTSILDQFSADEDHFVSMNPSNGWGDFYSFRALLTEMRDQCQTHPSAVWHFWG